jgi:hypothetical protein
MPDMSEDRRNPYRVKTADGSISWRWRNAQGVEQKKIYQTEEAALHDMLRHLVAKAVAERLSLPWWKRMWQWMQERT